MQEDDVLRRLTDVFGKVFGRAVLLQAETTAKDVEGWDSLNHMQIVMKVEDEFKIKLFLPEIVKMQSIGDMVELIKSKAKT